MSARLSGRPRHDDGDGGFTLIEMVVSIALSAIILTALAGGLASSLRALSVQKARTQGNEIATLAIESLQSLSYDNLGICAPAANPPTGLAVTAPPAAGCPASFPANGGQDPCRTGVEVSGTDGFVRSTYTCDRNNISYQVRRYIAWGDAGQTTKRLAVFVGWSDAVGPHEVSQQSSLRAPGAQDVAGLPIPQITAVDVNPLNVTLDAVGGLTADVSLTATTSGLAVGASTTTKDKVYVSFLVLDAANARETASVFLSSTNGTNWTGSIPAAAGYRFGNGSQIFTFSVIRAKDGKGNSLPGPKVTFSGATTGTGMAPSFTSWTVTPSSDGPNVKITPSGALVPTTLKLAAVTLDATAADSVEVVFPTRSGAVSARLSATMCTDNVCNWAGEIPREAGYAFSSGSKTFTFTVAQVYTVPGTGSTSAEQRTVVFEV